MSIVDVSVISPEWSDVIIVTVDYSKIPLAVRTEYGAKVLADIKAAFPNNKVLLISAKTG